MKERLLAAASEILSTEGPAALTTRRVCEAVGVTMPTLYHHFPNRDALVQAVYDHALGQFMAKKRSLELSDDPLDDLRRGCELVLDFVAKNKNVAIAVVARGLEDPSILGPSYQLLRERVQRAKQAGLLHVPEAMATAMTWSAVQGLLVQTIAPVDPAVNLGQLRKRLLDGLITSL
ncbi:MAG: TetR/AcrR family transcriptional regulator [Myxococcaceae bacterium]